MAETRNLGKNLENKGFIPQQSWKKRDTVSCGEKGKMYIAQTLRNTACCVYRIDGVIIGPKQPKCDYLMLVRDETEKPVGESFIEIKGCDIMHAVEQLEATLRHFNVQRCSELDCRARVVTSRSIPGSVTKGEFERARVRFNKLYSCKLKRIKLSCPDTPAFG